MRRGPQGGCQAVAEGLEYEMGHSGVQRSLLQSVEPCYFQRLRSSDGSIAFGARIVMILDVNDSWDDSMGSFRRTRSPTVCSLGAV